MKQGLNRFEYYLQKTEVLLSQAAAEKNAGLWLYANDLRTPLFMLEGLAKLYAGLHNEKRFSKLKEDFKLLEDILGAVDYYDAFAKEFSADPNIPSFITEYLQAQSREKIQRLNDLLQERSWMGEGADRIRKIRKKLYDADWKKDSKEIKGIAGFYKKSIDEINGFVTELNFKFTNIELHVHALRRKLRWLSIYPRALQGAIQLTDSHVPDEQVTKYLTESVINSPFNKMPEAGSNECFLMLEKNYFLALSCMIAELGRIKDSGLKVIAVTEAFQQTKNISQTEAFALAYRVLGDQQPYITTLLAQASDISSAYLKQGNLDKLLSGIASID